MGKRGPAPTPTNIKHLRGTYRADRAAPNEPRPKVQAPSCPRHLTGVARKEWRRVVPELVQLGVITALDRATLEGYCRAYAEWLEMEEEIEEKGRTQSTESGYVAVRPEVAMRDKALRTMRDFARELGLTPAARTRVSSEKPQQPKTQNPFLEAANG